MSAGYLKRHNLGNQSDLDMWRVNLRQKRKTSALNFLKGIYSDKTLYAGRIYSQNYHEKLVVKSINFGRDCWAIQLGFWVGAALTTLDRATYLREISNLPKVNVFRLARQKITFHLVARVSREVRSFSCQSVKLWACGATPSSEP